MAEFMIIGVIGVVLLLALLLVGDLLESMNHFEFLGGEFFSSAGVAGFIGALGFGGALVLGLSDSFPLAIGAGIGIGLLFGWLVTWATNKLKAGESGQAMSTQGLLGASGMVISSIPADGYGEVRLYAGGQPMKINARCDQELPGGTRVWVSDVLSATAVQVRPSDPLASAEKPELDS